MKKQIKPRQTRIRPTTLIKNNLLIGKPEYYSCSICNSRGLNKITNKENA